MKELTFVITEKGSSCAMLRALDVQTRAFSEAIHVPRDTLLQLWRLHGPPDRLETLKGLLARPPRAPLLEVTLVAEAPREILAAGRWRRPQPDDALTLERLLAELAWSEAVVSIHGVEGRVEVHLLGACGRALTELYARLVADFAASFTFQLLNVGGAGATRIDDVRRFTEEEQRLLSLALDRGYYDDPKGCGTRELAEATGFSKSTVARRLRSIEKRALSEFRRAVPGPGAPPAAVPRRVFVADAALDPAV